MKTGDLCGDFDSDSTVTTRDSATVLNGGLTHCVTRRARVALRLLTSGWGGKLCASH